MWQCLAFAISKPSQVCREKSSKLHISIIICYYFKSEGFKNLSAKPRKSASFRLMRHTQPGGNRSPLFRNERVINRFLNSTAFSLLKHCL